MLLVDTTDDGQADTIIRIFLARMPTATNPTAAPTAEQGGHTLDATKGAGAVGAAVASMSACACASGGCNAGPTCNAAPASVPLPPAVATQHVTATQPRAVAMATAPQSISGVGGGVAGGQSNFCPVAIGTPCCAVGGGGMGGGACCVAGASSSSHPASCGYFPCGMASGVACPMGASQIGGGPGGMASMNGGGPIGSAPLAPGGAPAAPMGGASGAGAMQACLDDADIMSFIQQSQADGASSANAAGLMCAGGMAGSMACAVAGNMSGGMACGMAGGMAGGVVPMSAAPMGSSRRPVKHDGNLMKQGWTPEEDATIVRMVQLTGQKWSFIACALPGRTDDAVRNRYLRLQKKKTTAGQIGNLASNSPTVTSADLAECQATKKGDMWTAEEDSKIMEGVSLHGFKWQMIAAALPGRSANAVRNRYLRCSPGHEAPSTGAVPTTVALAHPGSVVGGWGAFGGAGARGLGGPPMNHVLPMAGVLGAPDDLALINAGALPLPPPAQGLPPTSSSQGLNFFWDAAALYGEALGSIQDSI